MSLGELVSDLPSEGLKRKSHSQHISVVHQVVSSQSQMVSDDILRCVLRDAWDLFGRDIVVGILGRLIMRVL